MTSDELMLASAKLFYLEWDDRFKGTIYDTASIPADDSPEILAALREARSMGRPLRQLAQLQFRLLGTSGSEQRDAAFREAATLVEIARVLIQTNSIDTDGLAMIGLRTSDLIFKSVFPSADYSIDLENLATWEIIAKRHAGVPVDNDLFEMAEIYVQKESWKLK